MTLSFAMFNSFLMSSYVVCLCLLLCLAQCFDEELWSLSLSIAMFNMQSYDEEL